MGWVRPGQVGLLTACCPTCALVRLARDSSRNRRCYQNRLIRGPPVHDRGRLPIRPVSRVSFLLENPCNDPLVTAAAFLKRVGKNYTAKPSSLHFNGHLSFALAHDVANEQLRNCLYTARLIPLFIKKLIKHYVYFGLYEGYIRLITVYRLHNLDNNELLLISHGRMLCKSTCWLKGS